jgi:ABC-type nitrate/sulfonate/bicarbonate transport system permease component
VALWGLASLTLRNVPSPAAVFENAALNLFSSEHLPGIGLPRGGYLPHLALTAGNVLLGGGLGALIGVATGLLSASSRLFDEFTAPAVSLLGTTPIVIMAPFFLMWFGLSGGAQLALVAMYTATILHLFSSRGARNIAARYLDYGSTLGARRAQLFWWIRLPGAAPEIFGGLRIALSGAWGLAAVTEMLGGQFGSGRVISALRAVYDLTGIMAVILLLGAMAILLDGLLVLARHRLLRWA